MDTTLELGARTRRARPSWRAWDDAMTETFIAHDQHNRLPYHVLEAVGESLGVAARSVETRYGRHLSVMEAMSGWSLDAATVARIADAKDFIDAYTHLVDAGDDVPSYPLFDRALWRSPRAGLARLRRSESRRRQAISEWGPCFYCWADFRLAVGGAAATPTTRMFSEAA